MTWAVELPNEEATARLGRALGAVLAPGDTVCLQGPLGAGKTALARHTIWALGVAEDVAVTSPTFALVQEYSGDHEIVHVDLYRVQSATEIAELGLEEYQASGRITLIEWARPEDFPMAALWVRLEYLQEGRSAALAAASPRGKKMLQELRARW